MLKNLPMAKRINFFFLTPTCKVCSYSWHLIGKQYDFFQVFLYLLVLPLLLAELSVFKWFVPLFFVKCMLNMYYKKVEKYLECSNMLLHHPFKKDICFKIL